ncbi:IclR family transcriptional regulator [Nesterenkonia sp. DZ6]|uniref:IclR family transcriptional regulator n=1 Tax=Nesterenkonia sp. DZ6 TaxID=2901229 RepID=UPI001F4C55AA|nr:IclR family transcriptional regulator [Nesterenkonia sp. DZ6]MCH8560337.1 IclR family transcriptional regulator [Nesterenkonia sp. DZ6]
MNPAPLGKATGEPYRSPVKSVTGRALEVLGSFDLDHQLMTLTEISRRAGIPMSTVYRLVGELVDGRFLERFEHGRYGLGIRLWEMGVMAPWYGQLREMAMPFLLSLQYESGDTVQLAVCEGVHALYLEKLTADTTAPHASRIGSRMPLHATGIGKVLLAFGEKAFTEAILAMPLERYTEATLTDRNSLTRELTQIRSQRYALSHQEYHPGSSSVAVPVFAGPALKAAIGIVSYSMREDLDRYVPTMLDAANKLGERLTSEQFMQGHSRA